MTDEADFNARVEGMLTNVTRIIALTMKTPLLVVDLFRNSTLTSMISEGGLGRRYLGPQSLLVVAFLLRAVSYTHLDVYKRQGLQRRRRKGSGDLPGLQSRRFGPSRVEWWVRLPHASAKVSLIQGVCGRLGRLRGELARMDPGNGPTNNEHNEFPTASVRPRNAVIRGTQSSCRVRLQTSLSPSGGFSYEVLPWWALGSDERLGHRSDVIS